MTHTTASDPANRQTSPSLSAAVGKVVVLAGTDRETAAHARVLLDTLRQLARDVVVVTDRPANPEAFGNPDVSVVGLDGADEWRGLLRKVAKAWRLARIVEAERPDVLHAIGLRPAAFACVALRLAHAGSAVVHLPDLAALDLRSGGLAWPYRKAALRLLASLLHRPNAFLLAAGEDDLGELRARGIDPAARFALLGCAGIDPDVYPVLPPPQAEMPIAAFVGPVHEASGMQALLQAFERLWARGLRLQLEIHGEIPADGIGSDALSGEWARWSVHPGVRCFGWPSDAREIWRRADICVWPAQARQALPRTLLEAAACGRALVVTDSGGGRIFVRNEVEGLIVAAGDAADLGTALERLARDAGLRHRLGAAARLRVLQGFTEAHVKEVLRGAYLSLPAAGLRVAS
jgi:glycosyltransferase involved in cell wall biosynthesis